MEGTGTPFTPDIKVIRTTIPNAFAQPGGHSFYFSALLDQTETADEFAGVMAHELGLVVHRHGMEQLISTSAIGLLVGFILGDMTGLSVAGGVGAALIDSRFSREAELQADRFAADLAKRMAFQPAGLAALLERVAGDDQMTKALALLSTHPLTSERREALEALPQATPVLAPLSDAEWQAIKAKCGTTPVAPSATDPGKTDKNSQVAGAKGRRPLDGVGARPDGLNQCAFSSAHPSGRSGPAASAAWRCRWRSSRFSCIANG